MKRRRCEIYASETGAVGAVSGFSIHFEGTSLLKFCVEMAREACEGKPHVGFSRLSAGTPTQGGGQEGQELPFILNSSISPIC